MIQRVSEKPPFYRFRHCLRPLRWLLIGGAISLQACASVPTQEMSDARQSIQAARLAASASGVDSSGLERAELLLRQARQDLRVGNYRAARRSANEARLLASKFRQKVAAN